MAGGEHAPRPYRREKSVSHGRPGWGTGFGQDDIDATRMRGGLLTMELELSRECNLRCIYCYATSGEQLDNELSLAEITSAVDQAVRLGARRIIVLGGGEPLCYPHLMDVLQHIHAAGAGIELFTNGTLITAEKARAFMALGVQPVVKMNSLRADVQDRLAGRRGSFAEIRRGLELLVEAGYPAEGLSLGAQTVVCRHNLPELEEMWIWLRSRNITPYFEMLTLQGRARQHDDLVLSPRELEQAFTRLARLDAEHFGHVWEPHPSVAAFCCNRHEYSCTVTATGDVVPCPGVDLPVGNIRRASLADILSGSPVIRDLRNVRTLIKDQCAACDLRATCYGCRGMAYQATGDYLAADPLCWRHVATGKEGASA